MTDVHEEREQSPVKKDAPVKKEPTHHAKIMRGIVTPIFGLLAVACIVLGVLNQTIWKPNPSISASAPVENTQYLLIDQGVADLVDSTVTVTATSASATANDGVCMALTTSKDAAGWLAGQSYERITGLSSWTELSHSMQEAQGEAKTSDADVAFKDSDMWSQVSCDAGRASLNLKEATDTSVILVDFGQKISDGTIDLHWTRHNIPNFALPWYFGGGLCAILAVLCASVFAMDMSARRKRISARAEKARAERHERRKEEPKISEALAGSLAALKPRGKSKKRGAARHGRHSGSAGATGRVQAGESTPTIVDPHSRNMLAERTSAAGADTGAGLGTGDAVNANETETSAQNTQDTAATSVISPEELQSYFARFAQEVGVDDSAQTAADSADDSANNSTTSSDASSGTSSDTDGKEND